jgi:hypothetical protein
MMNADATRQTSAEAMSQASSYFQQVDNAVLMGDTNKRYWHSTNGCYAPSIPVHANSYTTVVISPSFDNTADLWNSYIYCQMACKLTLSGDPYDGQTAWDRTYAASPINCGLDSEMRWMRLKNMKS